MPTTVRATAQKPIVPAVPGISKATDTELRIQFVNVDVGVAGPQVLNFVFGKAASPPATYADLANPDGSGLAFGDQSTYVFDTAEAFYSGSWAYLHARANAAWTIGDTVYVCLFSSLTPSSGDVPLAVSGPLLVIA